MSDDYLSCISMDNNGDKWIGTISGGVAVYKEAQQTEMPVKAGLLVSPNPVKTTATFSFQLPAATHIYIQLFNTSGQLIQTLYNQTLQKGEHSFTRDRSRHAPGVYYCSMFYNKTRKITKALFLQEAN